LPPTRPTEFPATPPATSAPAPQKEGLAKDPPTRDSSVGDSSSNQSFYGLHTLPPATRARMHECGVEWQHMKTTGAATDKTWYTFAQTCLAR